MDNMECKKILIAMQHNARVMYCEAHNVAELEIGAVSLRLDVESFAMLGDCMAEAIAKLAVVQEAKRQHEALIKRLRSH